MITKLHTHTEGLVPQWEFLPYLCQPWCKATCVPHSSTSRGPFLSQPSPLQEPKGMSRQLHTTDLAKKTSLNKNKTEMFNHSKVAMVSVLPDSILGVCDMFFFFNTVNRPRLQQFPSKLVLHRDKDNLIVIPSQKGKQIQPLQNRNHHLFTCLAPLRITFFAPPCIHASFNQCLVHIKDVPASTLPSSRARHTKDEVLNEQKTGAVFHVHLVIKHTRSWGHEHRLKEHKRTYARSSHLPLENVSWKDRFTIWRHWNKTDFYSSVTQCIDLNQCCITSWNSLISLWDRSQQGVRVWCGQHLKLCLKPTL